MYKFHKNGRDYSLLREETVKLYCEHKLKAKEIGKILNIDRRVASKYLKEAGIVFSKYNKTDINSEIFDQIDTEEKAYWMGFLFADGCVSDKGSIELSLQLLDLPHLEKFKKFLKYDGKIYADHFRCRLCFRDQKIAQDLRKWGCIERKSLVLEFPKKEAISYLLLPHFIRGYFDGDGHIRKKGSISIEIVGTPFFLQSMQEILGTTGRIAKLKSKAFSITFSGNNARIFCSIIYDQPAVYLERKYAAYLSQIEKYEFKRSKAS
jgi:hypothetical protein